MLNNIRKNYKYKTGIAAFAAMTMSLFAVSCSNDEPLSPAEAGSITFTAPAQIVGGSSRVSYIQNKGFIKVTWEEGDVVQLFPENGTTPMAKFEVTKVEGNKATFTCKDAAGITNLSNVSGVMRYMPALSESTKKIGDKENVEGLYIQTKNGLDNNFNDNTPISPDTSSPGAEHLKYANVIEAKLDGVSLSSENIQFKNKTCIFRIILKTPYQINSGATVTLSGVRQDQGNGGLYEWGSGISQELAFDLGADEKLVVYIATPGGKASKGILHVALTDGTKDNKVTTYSRNTSQPIPTYTQGNEYTADFSNEEGKDADFTGGDFVDMGLTSGTCWATKNLGANNIIGEGCYGKYFSWGNVNPGNGNFDIDNKEASIACKVPETLLKENIIVEFKDNGVTKYKLAPDYDAATVAGRANDKANEWSTPTYDQWKELLDNCTWAWNSALSGYEVISQINNNMIFIPAAGYYDDNNLKNQGDYAYYWTSTPYAESSQDSWCIHISGFHRSLSEFWYPRYCGMSIRPVKQGTTNNN